MSESTRNPAVPPVKAAPDRRGFLSAAAAALVAGPAAVVAIEGHDTDGRFLSGETPDQKRERHRRYDARRRSAGNHHTAFLVALLDLVDDYAWSYLDGHRAGCDCPCCGNDKPDDQQAIRGDLAALRWTISNVRSFIDGQTVYIPERDDMVEVLLEEEAVGGDILRVLAGWADEIDGLYESEAINEPAVVGVSS